MKEYIEEVKKFFNSIYLFHNPFDNVAYIKERHIDKIGRIMYKYDQFIDKISQYALKRKNTHLKVVAPPILYNKDFKKVDLSELVQTHRKEILHFVDVVEGIFKQELLSNLYSNLRNIKIDFDKNIGTNSVLGSYNIPENYIVINNNLTDIDFQHAFYHELFHMASARSLTYAGFEYSNDEYHIGKAINEGYTDVMTYRYFDKQKKYSSGYDIEIQYATAIENIVGKELMERLYITSNLYGLINELKKYATEKEIIDFITKTDDILYSRKHSNPHEKIDSYKKIKNQDMERKIIEVNLFLASLKLRKNNEEDLAKQLLNHGRQSKLYTINGEEFGKNIYMECLTLFNTNDASYQLKNLFNAIGYDKLKDICFISGIPGLINELKKYSNQEDIDKYLKLLDTSVNKDMDKSTYLNDVFKYSSILDNYPLAIAVIKNDLSNDSNIKASINSGFRIDNDYSTFEYGKSYFINEYISLLNYRYKFCSSNVNDDDLYSHIIKLENIVGKSEMLKMFVLGDINGVTGELGKHVDKDVVNKIINSSWIDVISNRTYELLYDTKENSEEGIRKI